MDRLTESARATYRKLLFMRRAHDDYNYEQLLAKKPQLTWFEWLASADHRKREKDFARIEYPAELSNDERFLIRGIIRSMLTEASGVAAATSKPGSIEAIAANIRAQRERAYSATSKTPLATCKAEIAALMTKDFNTKFVTSLPMLLRWLNADAEMASNARMLKDAVVHARKIYLLNEACGFVENEHYVLARDPNNGNRETMFLSGGAVKELCIIIDSQKSFLIYQFIEDAEHDYLRGLAASQDELDTRFDELTRRLDEGLATSSDEFKQLMHGVDPAFAARVHDRMKTLRNNAAEVTNHTHAIALLKEQADEAEHTTRVGDPNFIFDAAIFAVSKDWKGVLDVAIVGVPLAEEFEKEDSPVLQPLPADDMFKPSLEYIEYNLGTETAMREYNARRKYWFWIAFPGAAPPPRHADFRFRGIGDDSRIRQTMMAIRYHTSGDVANLKKTLCAGAAKQPNAEIYLTSELFLRTFLYAAAV